jgi:hypothetical protein
MVSAALCLKVGPDTVSRDHRPGGLARFLGGDKSECSLRDTNSSSTSHLIEDAAIELPQRGAMLSAVFLAVRDRVRNVIHCRTRGMT